MARQAVSTEQGRPEQKQDLRQRKPYPSIILPKVPPRSPTSDRSRTTATTTAIASPRPMSATHLAIVPSWHPPYETRIDLQYPLHFDNSAERHDLDEKYPSDLALKNQMIDMVKGLRKKTSLQGVLVNVYLKRASTSMARSANPRNPKQTPPFFAVEILPGRRKERVRELYEILRDVIPRYFEVNEDPVIRFFIWRPMWPHEYGLEDESNY